MSDHREDVPDLPALHFWDGGRQKSPWARNGIPFVSIRKRRLFGSQEVIRQYMMSLDFAGSPHEAELIREAAMVQAGKRLKR